MASSPTPRAASTPRTTSTAPSCAARRRAVVHQPDLLFVDTLSLAADGHLYFTINQLHRQPDYRRGEDRREPPYAVMRTRVDATPVRLR
jgi:hypothetical protein